MAGPGSWLLHAAGPRSRDLPGFVLVGNGNEHPGPGFLDPKVTPVPVADPESGLENTDRPAYLSQQNFERRLALADRIDRDFRQRYAGPQIAAYDQLYKDAVRLLGSVDLEAFDIARAGPPPASLDCVILQLPRPLLRCRQSLLVIGLWNHRGPNTPCAYLLYSEVELRLR